MTVAEPPIIPAGVITQEFHTPRNVRRGVIAGVAGNVLEWYDFALFGFFAQQIGAHFFPADVGSVTPTRRRETRAIASRSVRVLWRSWAVKVTERSYAEADESGLCF